MTKTYRLLSDQYDGAMKGDLYEWSESRKLYESVRGYSVRVFKKEEIQNSAFFEEVVELEPFKPGSIMPKEQLDFEEIVRLNNVILQLKCELESVKNMRNVDKKCGSCGDYLVLVRGRYPTDDKRYVCPDCLVSRLDQIRERTLWGGGE